MSKLELKTRRIGDVSGDFFDRRSIFEDVFEDVKKIIDDVRIEGDNAIRRYEKRFDGVELEDFTVKEEEFERAFNETDKKLIEHLKIAYDRIYHFHEKQMRENWFFEEGGITLGQIFVPLEKVGCYVPSSYFSSLLMVAIPAKVAGVKEIYVCTPPNERGEINPLILIAASLTGVKLYKIGGAQAIAGMAYGTKSIPKVNKIVGPGNKYVTTAKMLLRDKIEIDFPAGPSEVLIIADISADPSFMASDLLAQAEHDSAAHSILVTTSRRLCEDVRKEVIEQREGLSVPGRIDLFLADSIEECINFANRFAPEHLEIVCEDYISILKEIKNAGSIFLGNYSPVSTGDYASGTNHILPTAGYAKVFSGLSVDDFLKRISVQMLGREGLSSIGDMVISMAGMEGLNAHANSVRKRMI
ncbi:MAG: histidinol dehydrogenase [Candidatus Methanolliviera hydrocarbonicum]|uniref:Histidinol dehydrogenase n=1 Tax=Candidatus Methanolliviera hydrocarbonicum TaxID=2491085 RepID=A0A520KVX9_9EURY|nr:MAG: histidinol dehydrogenase [Candidatus Methanolliviera hydrocarbonicum]